MKNDQEYESVLQFWLREVDERGAAISSAHWWKKDPSFDKEIRDTFGGLYDAIRAGEREDWLSSPRGRLAYIIVLDQFSRNMYRGTAKMYAADAQCLKASLEGIELEMDRAVGHSGRILYYMPTMHSEDLAIQDRCVALFEAFAAELEEGKYLKGIQGNVKFANHHRDFVAQFGRFPHRNDILGRESTPEEIEFLKQPGSSF